ncbi:hypothetical protein ACQ4PT_004164 [Festuca glaucescens]
MSAAASNNVESLKQALKKMEPIRERLLALLREPNGHGHGRAITQDSVWFRMAFLAHKLSAFVAVLRRQLEKLPIYDDDSSGTTLQLQDLTRLAEKDVGRLLDAWEEAPWCALPWRKARAAERIERNLAWFVWKGLLLTNQLARDVKSISVTYDGPYLPHAAAAGRGRPLIGIDSAKEKLGRWLEEEDDSLKVISIVGPAGVGKTTLAMEMYGKFKGQFDCLVTAKMSQRPHKDKFLRHILSQTNTHKTPATDQTDPHTSTMQIHKNIRYLVLIDDIWDTSDLGLKSSPLLENKLIKAWDVEEQTEKENKEDQGIKESKEDKAKIESREDLGKKEGKGDQVKKESIEEYQVGEEKEDKSSTILDDWEFKSWTLSEHKKDWEIIKYAFPDDGLGSRIIVTTRITSIARSCSSASDELVHEVHPLNELDSERLLLAEAFGSDDALLPEHSRLVCDEILRRCEGIPLFITRMAEKLKKVQKNSKLCSLEEVPQLLDQLEHELSYSYNDLFYGLELLPLSMGTVFPLGYMIDKEHLIRAWVREGLIYSENWRDCKVKAEHCFSELVDRNIIRLAAIPLMEETWLCQMDPFVHRFLVSKSAKVNFVTTISMVNPSNAPGGSVRRLSIQHPAAPRLLENIDLSGTDSLTISGAAKWIPLDRLKSDSLKSLVVLDLEGWNNLTDKNLSEVFSSVKPLQLKYLSVRNTHITQLPPEIEGLPQLRELDIGGCTEITETLAKKI